MEGHRRRAGEAGRFLAVGGVATIVALLLFNLLVHGFAKGGEAPLADHVLLAYVIANTVGMVVSYRGTRGWAFRDRPPVQADGGRSAFVVINLATMLIPIGCLAFSRDVLGLDDPISDNLSANVIGLVLGMVARFHLFRIVIFRSPPELPSAQPAVSLPGRHEPGEGAVTEGSTATATSRCARARPPGP